MKKLLFLLLLPLISFSQIQQTFQWTGDANHYPSLNSFFTEKITSLDKIVENTDFNNTALSNPHPYSYNSIDGDVKIDNSPLPDKVHGNPLWNALKAYYMERQLRRILEY